MQVSFKTNTVFLTFREDSKHSLAYHFFWYCDTVWGMTNENDTVLRISENGPEGYVKANSNFYDLEEAVEQLKDEGIL